MAKSEKTYQYEHLLRANQYSGRLTRIYDSYVEELTKLVSGLKIDPDKPFSFADFPQTKERLNKTLSKIADEVKIAIDKATREEWEESNLKNDELVDYLFVKTGIPRERIEQFYNRNLEALEAFQGRKEGGLGLSDRVWKITDQYKGEVELGIDVALGEGRSAAQLSRDVRQYLKDPDNLFRRVRNKRGQLVLSKRAAAFHPGQGVYRSSYKNAMRLARTEVNMAYREADAARWNELPFVVGFEIKLSHKHPEPDICNDLAGKYPKTFKFVGWHPHCFCYCTSILASDEEINKLQQTILNGGDISRFRSKNEVTDVPGGFKEWVINNADRATGWKSTPYFIRDNFIDGDVSKGLKTFAAPPPKGKTKFKTEDEKEAIRKQWHERRAIRRYGDRILRYMDGISDIDTGPLATLLKGGDVKAILSEAKALAAKGKEILGLKYIDDPMKVARQYSAADAKLVNESVEKKIATWTSEGKYSTLADQKKKLEFEIDWIGKTQKYETWKVAQDAYKRQLAIVDTAIEKEAIVESVSNALKLQTTSKVFATLKTEWEALLANPKTTNAELKVKAEEINKRYKKLLADRKKSLNTADAYSQARKDAAMWTDDPKEADKRVRSKCGEVWKGATELEKDAAYGYTAGSSYINEPLRGQRYIPYDKATTLKAQRSQSHIEALTDLIERSEYDFDMWLQRGVDYNGARGLLGVDLYSANPQTLVGKVVTEKAFSSCGMAKGAGFDSRPVIYNIYCPKGTKALYCEPFSAFGNGSKRAWDGVAKQSSIGYEAEILLQQGTTFRITKAEYSGGKWFIDMEVIDQNPLK
jgi:hypothetical protein